MEDNKKETSRERLIRSLDVISGLKEDWDAHGAKPISPGAVEAARLMIEGFDNSILDNSSLFPNCEGHIYLQGNFDKTSLICTITDSTVTYLVKGKEDGNVLCSGEENTDRQEFVFNLKSLFFRHCFDTSEDTKEGPLLYYRYQTFLSGGRTLRGVDVVRQEDVSMITQSGIEGEVLIIKMKDGTIIGNDWKLIDCFTFDQNELCKEKTNI